MVRNKFVFVFSEVVTTWHIHTTKTYYKQCHVLDDATCFSHVKHTCKSIEWTCPSVISLLIMEIAIKIQSHSSLV